MSASEQQEESTSPSRLAPAEVRAMTHGMVKLDDACYGRFFQHYYNRLWAYAAVLTNGSEEDIEETLQTAFEKVVRGIRVFEREDAFWAWLATIVKNSYFDRHRKRQRRQRLLELLTLQPLRPDTQAQTHSRDHSEVLVHQALRRLGDSDRVLVMEKYFEGASYQQLASRYQISEKAVESKLVRARKRLKAVLKSGQSEA